MHGHECRKDAFSALQRLSQTQEKQLTEWILIQDALGLPPTHSQIRQFAQRMLAVKETTHRSENTGCKHF
ncbi:Tc5 transposase DNA-binding domain-containing protein [Hirsutella rhossiliensis]